MATTVFFDIGSTLLHPCPTVPEMFASVAQERGHQITVRDVEPFMALADAYYDEEYLRDGDFWCSHERATEIWKGMYRIIADAVGLESDGAGMADAVHERYLRGEAWALYPDVVPCLRALKAAGLRLGVISNWDAELTGLLREVGLLPYFDEVLASAEVGYRKPDPVIFELACERMGCKPCEAFHVGDLPEADGAAAAVGITPVIIDRGDAHGETGLLRVFSLDELPALVARSLAH